MSVTAQVIPVCSQLLWGAPRDETIGTMLLAHFRGMAQQPHKALFACNTFVSAQCLYQSGVALPVVPRVALYQPAGAIRDFKDTVFTFLRFTFRDSSRRFRFKEICVFVSSHFGPLNGVFQTASLESPR